MSNTTKTSRTSLMIAGLTLTLLSLPATAFGDDAVVDSKNPTTVGATLLATPAEPYRLPVAPMRMATVKENRDFFRWKLSLVPLAASQALDVSSSWGMRELNPVLAGRDGRFGAQAATVKLGVVGALVGIQYLIVKKHPKAALVFEKINWAGAALTSSFAVHNYTIR